MTGQRLRALFLLSCLVPNFVFGLSGNTGLVLCIADNGHFAVEQSHENTCHHDGLSGNASSHDTHTLLPSDAPSIPFCLDIRLQKQTEAAIFTSQQLTVGPVHFPVPANACEYPLPLFTETAVNGLLPQPPPIGNGVLAQWSSVILLL